MRDRARRIIGGVIATVVLFAMPIVVEPYYKLLYYIGTIIVILVMIYNLMHDEETEQKFYRNWRVINKQKAWKKILRETGRFFIIILATTLISQLFWHGHTPLEIISELTTGEMVWIFILLTVFSVIGGLVSCNEKDKRYKKIFYRMKEVSK